MALAGKRIAILAEEDFEDSELTEPMKAIRRPAWRGSIREAAWCSFSPSASPPLRAFAWG